MSKYVICALYKFVTLDDYQSLQAPLLEVMEANQIGGTLLLAQEGINGTVAATRENMDALFAWFRNDPRLADIDYKESFEDSQPFSRTKVKLKKEIVTMGVEGIDPRQSVGTYVKPTEWNQLISDPDVLVIDTRNDYEIEIGTFERAVNPHTDSFREFPDYVEQQLDPSTHKKVAMFCTGGIRCEKSTAFLKEKGFDEVYHLEGGILKYLEEVPENESLWNGECYVFDSRVAVNHDLERGSYAMCNACRLPITQADMESEHYEQGVSCPKCIDKHTDAQKAAFREREYQVRLARERGEQHVGGEARKIIEQRRAMKKFRRQRQNQDK